MKKQNTLRALGGAPLGAITLLLVLVCFLAACEDGYRPNIRGISFYNGTVNKKNLIDDNHPFTVNNTSYTTLVIKFDLPSSIRELSIKVSYDASALDIDDPYFADEIDGNDKVKGIIKAEKIAASPFLELEVKAKGTTPTTITVTVEPGGVKAMCTVTVGGAPPPPGTVATPTASPAAGAVTSGTTVTLSTTPADATIHYTTDGSTPTTSSPTYSGPITITTAVTIKAIAVKSGMTDSGIMSAAYTITASGTVDTPTASPAAGAVTSGTTVTLSTTPADATIHYTTDGSTPTTSSPTYSGPITITTAVTIKAIAVKSGMTDSGIMSAAYTIATYSISLDKTGTETFPNAAAGYGTQTPLLVTVTNTGNQSTDALTVALSGTNATSFTLSTASISSIGVGDTKTFTVVPNTGLSGGPTTYNATVTVSGSHSISETFNVSFTVYKTIADQKDDALTFIKTANINTWVTDSSLSTIYPQDKFPAYNTTVLYYINSEVTLGQISMTMPTGWSLKSGDNLSVNGSANKDVKIVFTPVGGSSPGDDVEYTVKLAPVAEYHVVFESSASGTVTIKDNPGNTKTSTFTSSGKCIGDLTSTDITYSGSDNMSIDSAPTTSTTITTPTSKVYTITVSP
jgi:hypothetical protein